VDNLINGTIMIVRHILLHKKKKNVNVNILIFLILYMKFVR